MTTIHHETARTKVCADCQVESPVDNFYDFAVTRNKTIHVYKAKRCKRCQYGFIRDARNADPVKREKYLRYLRDYKEKKFVR